MLIIQLGIFISFMLLFLSVTFMARKEFRLYVIIANVIFGIITYACIPQLLGIPRPLDYSIPLYGYNWNQTNVKLLGYWIPEEHTRIYVLLKENPVRLYSFPYDDEFHDKLKKIRESGMVDEPSLTLDGVILGGTASHVHLNDPPIFERPPKDELPETSQHIDEGTQ